MKDINFFSYHINSKKKNTKKSMNIFVFIIVSIIVFGGFTGWAKWKIKSLEQAIDDTNKTLESKDLIDKITELNDDKQKKRIMLKYYDAVTDINNKFTSIQNIESNVICKIAECMPKEMSLQILSIDEKGIVMQGSCNNRTSIAEFEHNLKLMNEFKKVHVKSIDNLNDEEDTYIFTVNSIINPD